MAEDYRTALFEFRGRMSSSNVLRRDVNREESVEEYEYEIGNTRRMVRMLEESSGKIADEIETELKHMIPPGVLVRANINFYEGSVEWEGVITVMGAMALISDTVGFWSIFSRLSGNVVDKVVHRTIVRTVQSDIPRQHVRTQFTLSTTENSHGQPKPEFHSNSFLNLNDDVSITNLARFTVINTILLGILVALQLLPLLVRLAEFLQSP